MCHWYEVILNLSSCKSAQYIGTIYKWGLFFFLCVCVSRDTGSRGCKAVAGCSKPGASAWPYVTPTSIRLPLLLPYKFPTWQFALSLNFLVFLCTCCDLIGLERHFGFRACLQACLSCLYDRAVKCVTFQRLTCGEWILKTLCIITVSKSDLYLCLGLQSYDWL